LIRQGIEHYLSVPFQLPRDPKAWEETKNLMLTILKKNTTECKRNWKREEIYE